MLSEIVAKSPAAALWPDLLIGNESSDDAAVYRLNDTQALVATTDFFSPIVDDAFDYGRIAAANALSDIYAMGARPVMALALVGMPVAKLPAAVIKRVLDGGQAVCATAGIPLAGGHSIDAPEPLYGLVALGLVHPDKVKRNNRAQAGDALILGKALGIGVMGAALKKGKLSDAGYSAMVDSAVRLNTPGTALADIDGVHAITDITGFGLVGHLLEICRGSGVAAHIRFGALPILPEVRELAQLGFFPGAAGRNWDAYQNEVVLPGGTPDWKRKLLCDPQTSGGLLIACAPDAADEVLRIFHEQGFAHARKIGRLEAGEARVEVE